MNGVSWRRPLAAGCLLLAILLLPALVAGSRIDAPAAAGEWRRLERTLQPDDGAARSLLTDGFYRATVGAAALPAGAAAAASLLARARLMQVAGIAAVAMLAFLAVMRASGRAAALVTVLWLALLPPVGVEGHVLRPETPATMFGLLALLLLQCIPDQQRAVAWPRRRPFLVALVVTAAGASALAIAALPSSGILLLVPATAAIVAGGQLLLRLLSAMRRLRDWARLPLPAVSARLWPWALCPVLALLAAWTMLELATRDPAGLPPTASGAGLLPAAAWARLPLLALAALGALRLLLRVGLRLGRRGRLGADALLGFYCAALLLQRLLRDPLDDALPAAVPMAVLLTEGLAYAVLLVGARFLRRRH